MANGDRISVLHIRAPYGCSYRVGERPHDIMARSRTWMLWLPWAAMGSVSVLQYGCGVAITTMQPIRGLRATGAFWVIALWVIFQAGAAVLTAVFRRRLNIGPSTAMCVGAILAGVGPLTLSFAGDLGTAVLGYSVLSGIGAGIVYATSLFTVAHWYPEQRGAKVGLVSGAFGYGAVPFIVVFTTALRPDNRPAVFASVGLIILVVVAVCGAIFREPPVDWWPAEVDPKLWAIDKRLNRSLLGNAPAIRQYRPIETVRTPAFTLLYMIAVVASAAALLAIVYVPSIAMSHGISPVLGGAAVAVLALVSGGGRGIANRISDRFGRHRTLSLALTVQGCALLGVAISASARSAGGIIVCAALSGLAGGAFYSLCISLVADYFGERNAVPNFGLVYSAKMFGGLIGVGLPALLIPSGRLDTAFVAAGLVCLGIALVPRQLRRPGYPVCRLPN
jgi:MFS family permease